MPRAQVGTFATVNVVLWRILKGKVRVSFPNLELTGRSGQWIAMIRGVRTQEFSSDAFIESVHLHFDTLSAEWTGPPAAVFRENQDLHKTAAFLAKIVPQEAGQGRNPPRKITHVTGFAQQALLQEAVWKLCGNLIPLLAKTGIQLSSPEISDSRVAKSMAAIDALPLALPWNPAKMAQSTGLSLSQLNRLWHQENRGTPWRHWDLRRMRYAREKLENSDTSIKEIASDLGFVHLAQFSNWFHSRQGVSPRAYRGI